MQLNTLRLYRLVHAWFIAAIFFASLLAVTFYYFYFKISDQEAAMMGLNAPIAHQQPQGSALDAQRLEGRLEKKRSLPAIAPADVKDAFDPARVPGNR